MTLRQPVLAGQFVSHSASQGTLVLSPQQAHPQVPQAVSLAQGTAHHRGVTEHSGHAKADLAGPSVQPGSRCPREMATQHQNRLQHHQGKGFSI